MLASFTGLFTTVDLNSTTPSYYWRGEKLANVVSCLAINTSKQCRVSLRVLDPAKVTPALDSAERARLHAVYAEMVSAGIVVLIGQAA